MQQKQDQKLEEVRAILQRLQRISAGAEEDEAPVVPSPVYPARSGSSRNALVGAASPAPPAGLSTDKKLVAVAVPVFAALGLVGTVLWSLTGEETPPARESKPAAESKAPPAPSSEPQKNTAAVAPRVEPAAPERAAPERPAAAPAVAIPATSQPANPDAERLAVAQGLMDKGKVSEARRVLKNDLASRHPEAALLLARSFDPNSLQLIANADAGPDPAEAERWYRRWSELASAEGLALDRERLDRIIKAMR